MARVQYSQTYEAKRSRIRRLPRLAEQSMFAYSKRDAHGVVETFRDGIARDSFRLARLADSTIRAKRRRGYRRPATPLFGLGTGGSKTYLNMMQVTPERNGYRVRPRRARHHESGLTLRELFNVHEFGAVVQARGRTIRIPPRPAFEMAYRRYLRRRRAEEPAEEVRRAMIEYVNAGRSGGFDRIRREAERRARESGN